MSPARRSSNTYASILLPAQKARSPTSRHFKTECAISFRLLDVKPCPEAHLICQAGFLAYGSGVCLPLLTCLKRVMQWNREGRLSEYSDRIVQDSHLIPSSYFLSMHLTQRSLHIFYYMPCQRACQAVLNLNKTSQGSDQISVSSSSFPEETYLRKQCWNR